MATVPHMIRPLHIVESWRPVTSGYTSRGWEILSAQAARADIDPHLFITSRHFHYTKDAPRTDLGRPIVLQPSKREQRLRVIYPHLIDTRHLTNGLVAGGKSADLLHVHWSSGIGRAAARAAQRIEKPLIAEVRFDLAGATTSGLLNRSFPRLETLLRRLYESHLRIAAHVVAASHTLGDLLLETYPTLRDRLTVVVNGVNHAQFFAGNSDALREQLGLSDKIIIGTTSNMLYYEGLRHLIDAVAALDDARLHLLFVGSGVEMDALRQRVAHKRVAATFVGRVPKEAVPDYLRAIDIFAVPRRDAAITRFASPIKIAEAMACGCAVVASELGDIGMMLAHDRGVLLPPDDVGALKGAIGRLAQDKSRLAALGERANDWAQTHLSWANAAEQYATIYGAVV